MAWEWSHTAEGVQSVHEQLHQKAENADNNDEAAAEWLVTTWAEIKAHIPEEYGEGDLDLELYEKKLVEAKEIAAKVGHEPIADDIWEFAENFHTCSNGGWDAYMCPFACHTIPFTPDDTH